MTNYYSFPSCYSCAYRTDDEYKQVIVLRCNKHNIKIPISEECVGCSEYVNPEGRAPLKLSWEPVFEKGYLYFFTTYEPYSKLQRFPLEEIRGHWIIGYIQESNDKILLKTGNSSVYHSYFGKNTSIIDINLGEVHTTAIVEYKTETNYVSGKQDGSTKDIDIPILVITEKIEDIKDWLDKNYKMPRKWLIKKKRSSLQIPVYLEVLDQSGENIIIHPNSVNIYKERQ